MNDYKKLDELNEKIDLLLSQTNAEYLSDYQIRSLLYQIDNLTIKRDLLQNKINSENTNITIRKKENNTNKNSSLHFIILFFIYLYVIYMISKS